MKIITFELTTPFLYAATNGSGTIECNHIDLVEPTGKVSHVCCAIEGLIQSSIMKMGDVLGDDVIEEAKALAESKKADSQDGDDDEEEKDGDGVLALMVSGGADMSKLVLHFRDLFKVVALMGGEKRITAARMDDMSHKDFRRMMGVYAANFVLD